MNLRIPSRDHLVYLLDALGHTGHGVEIGVYRGDYTRIILEHWKSGTMHLVDPWTSLEDYNDTINQENLEDDYNTCCKTLQGYIDQGRIVIKRGLSLDMAKEYPNEFFDFVYIDANHAEQHVYNDIVAWYPKLKKGGILAGHDYVEGYDWISVIPAVQRFFSEIKEDYYVTRESLPSWWSIKSDYKPLPIFV